MPFLSIIIPFNGIKRYLKDCLQSLKEENLEDVETILVLNGTKNNAEEFNDLIKEYEDELKMTVKSFDEDIGVSKARNEGLNMATGEYIYFLDGDDYIYKDGLNKLIAAAKETHADLISGERKKTYFIQERFEEELKGRKYAFSEREDLSDMEFCFKLIVARGRRDIEILSALHCLMKREIIEEREKIRFDDDKKYLADYAFMAKVIDKCEKFKGVEKAFYAKRRCEDVVNLQTLTYKIGNSYFPCAAEEFNQILKIIDNYDDSKKKKAIKKEIYRKFYSYYFKKFAKNFKFNLDDAWRNEYFDMMSEISKNFDMKMTGKDKNEIIALQNHDKKEVLKHVNKRNLKYKIKRLISIIKNRDIDWLKRIIYKNIFNDRKIKDNRIVFESFRGDFYTDSPKYIYEYLLEKYGKNYDYVWIMNDNKDIPGNPKTCKRFSLKYYYYMATAKYWVINRRQARRLKKRDEQIILSTWHGTPLKRLGLDLENIYYSSPKTKIIFYNTAKVWDYLVSPNRYTTNILRSAFGYEGEMLETGYPRNDILYNADDGKIEDIKSRLNIPKNKKVILYAPTFRDKSFESETIESELILNFDLNKLKDEISDEYVIIIRAHYYVSSKLDLTNYKGFAFDYSSYDDIAELYLISDILITDYSSVFFDFANLKRPILFYPYDLEEYNSVDRGFYIDIYNDLPGPLLFTTEEIIDSIKNINSVKEEYSEKYDEFYDEFCSFEDGTASKRIVEKVWGSH